MARMSDSRGDGRRQVAERHGRRSEAVAAFYLRMKGYRIVGRRFRTPAGEIDLIARRGRTLIFVEVKARTTRTAGLEAITPAGRARIARAAAAWLARYPQGGLSLRFDAVVLVPGRWPLHLRGAFDGEGRA